MFTIKFITQKLDITKMNEQEIYQKTAELIWSIMPEEAKIMVCEGKIYPEHNSYSFEWITETNQICWFEMDNIPHEIGQKIIITMEELRSLDIFLEKWTHFKISLTEAGKIDFEFAYIPEEDSWVSLDMRGISDLTEEELDRDYSQIPKELWKERLRIKNS